MAHSHTFNYQDKQDLIRQLDAMLQKLLDNEMEDYVKVRARYPEHGAPAFTMRLKRFERAGGQFPKVMGLKGKRILRLCVTPALDAWLRK